MRRFVFLPALAVLLHSSPALADKFVNTGPGTINTCDSTSRVGIGLAESDSMSSIAGLVIGGGVGKLSALQLNRNADYADQITGYVVNRQTYWGTGILSLEGGDNADPQYPFATWDMSTGDYWSAGGVDVFGDISTLGGIWATGEIQSIAGFRANGTALNVPDFVFEPGYKLRSLEETERFVKANRHLPEIPNAEAIKKDGINLAEMNLKLLQKVEELTLHAIAQEKRIQALEARLVSR